jgi:hypothetical protein
MIYDFYKYRNINDFDNIKKILLDISDKFKVVLIFLDREEAYSKNLINSSASCGSYVYVGVYDNLDLLIASFFHEMGHVLTNRTRYSDNSLKFHCELEAWNKGLSLGLQYGYYIRPDTYKYCMNKYLYTYINIEKREDKNFIYTDTYKYFFK